MNFFCFVLDAIIQRTVKKEFVDSTVLIIAHRLHTVMTCDRIMVMDAGMLVEFDKPSVLLQNPEGHLSKLVDATGPATAEYLRQLAQHNWREEI